jgi:hypothetical protein
MREKMRCRGEPGGITNKWNLEEREWEGENLKEGRMFDSPDFMGLISAQLMHNSQVLSF